MIVYCARPQKWASGINCRQRSRAWWRGVLGCPSRTIKNLRHISFQWGVSRFVPPFDTTLGFAQWTMSVQSCLSMSLSRGLHIFSELLFEFRNKPGDHITLVPCTKEFFGVWQRHRKAVIVAVSRMRVISMLQNFPKLASPKSHCTLYMYFYH